MPIINATGSSADISPLFRFYFWQPVYYKVDDYDLLSHSTENVVVGLVFTDMLDMIRPSRYSLMKPKRSSFVLTLVLPRNL